MILGGISWLYLVVVVAAVIAVIVLVVALIRFLFAATRVLQLAAEERRLRIDLLVADATDDD